MHIQIFSFVILLTLGSIADSSAQGFELPKEWTRDFTIDLNNSGGMQDRSLDIAFSYDSCIYTDRNGSVKRTRAIALTSRNRADILKKLLELRADKLRTITASMELDKESTSICFKYKTEFCLTDGSASRLHQDDEKNFSEIWRYLTRFATAL